MPAPATTQSEDDPLVGRVLQDRYRITRLLGRGGMGAVYEAQHLSIGNSVAIKVLHPKFASDPSIVARFRREAQATTHIRHHNIVGMFDLGELDDGALYLVMEYLDGRDWSRDLATEGPQPIAKVIHIATQVCDALSAAHEAGITHRDIKPENVYLIRRSGDTNFVKVVDFGISKVHGAAAELTPSLTQTGAALGTPYYMAPEQVHGRKDIDARTDIYALGIVLFQALTGRYPFDGETYPMLVMNIITQPLPQLGSYRPDLPPELQSVLERMVAKDRESRFSSADEVKAALRPFAHVADEPSAAVLPAAQPTLPSRSEVRRTGEGAAAKAVPARGRVGVIVGVVGGLLVAGALVGGAVALWTGAASRSDDVTAGRPERVDDVAPRPPEDPAPADVVPAGDAPAVGATPEPTAGTAVAGEPPVEPVVDPSAEDSNERAEVAAPPVRRPEPSRPRRTEREGSLTPIVRPLLPAARTEPAPARVGSNDAPILR